ncbi:uncharacterized protein T551_03539 [Pneumocystis jirovecii RU7]|uniref:Mitochondrial outer membrane transport complex Sam37/metaxin N-terminal domain-containing protein n=1 Tax=Pneumocystis jirovecii (strain RU7) TaxID=1408657 RepID=A0A0W4ZCY8_PNEJ7|nr:uncharacterized protein T551_03539 [Pneumocystis jirovecii RU7]KTW26239.1 hypothetical protein T551_03539 [Pneumocystis jirovecii RU7]
MIHAPPIVARLFEKFPCIQYPSLQVNSPIDTSRHHLFVAYEPHTPHGAPSYDLESLRWQTFLLLTGIPHIVLSASPHASPSGTLPFFVAASNTQNTQSILQANIHETEKNSAYNPIYNAYNPSNEALNGASVPSAAPADTGSASCTAGAANSPHSAVYALPSAEGRLWLARHGAELHPFAGNTALAADADSYLSLIENVLYDAWLYTCFMERENFEKVGGPRYVTGAWPLRGILKWQLSRQIKKRLSGRQKTGLLNTREIYADASHALSALAMRLGQDTWFFGADPLPGSKCLYNAK